MKGKVTMTAITVSLVTSAKIKVEREKETDFRPRVRGALVIWRQKIHLDLWLAEMFS